VTVLIALVAYLVGSLRVDERQHGVASPLPPTPFVVFRSLAASEYGLVALLGLTPGAARHVTHLACARVHYAAGRGLCAGQETRGNASLNFAYVVDESFVAGARIVLHGIPTRLRVAPTGDVGAITTYAEEESPAGERLATRTRVVNMSSGQQVADLREFRLDSASFPPPRGPVDIAGIAFERDGDRFFATLLSDAVPYLAAGSLMEKRLTIIRAGVATEALSPDGRRLAVKRLIRERGFWQLAVVDLSTWAERDLRQGDRSVDDQVEWLDDNHVVFHDVDGNSTALWMLPVDGVTGPRVLVQDAYSGSVQR
jgi:hypothetical protein